MQDVLTRLEILYEKEMKAWRKECSLRYDRSNMPGILLFPLTANFLSPWRPHSSSFNKHVKK